MRPFVLHLFSLLCLLGFGCSHRFPAIWYEQLPSVAGVDFSDVKPASPFECAGDWKIDAETQSDVSDPMTIRGKVIDSAGAAVAEARVGCWVMDWDNRWRMIAKTVSSADGEYTLDASFIRQLVKQYASMGKRYGRSDPIEYIADSMSGRAEQLTIEVYVFAVTPSNRTAWVSPQILVSRSAIECDLILRPTGGSVFGVAFGDSGEVITSAEVKLGSIVEQPDSTSLKPYLVPLGLSGWSTTTDRQGRFVFDQLPPNTEAYVNRLACWTNEPLRTSPQSETSPVALVLPTQRALKISGSIVHADGTLAVGTLVRSAKNQAVTDANGSYQIAVSPNERRLTLVPSDGDLELGWQPPIDRRAIIKKKPQPEHRLVAARWVKGVVVSSADSKPIQNVIVETNKKQLLARTDEEGRFRVLVASFVDAIRLMPGWLNDHELDHYVNRGRSLEVVLSGAEQDEEDLGDITFVSKDASPPMPIQVLLPDGTPASGVKVRSWLLPQPELPRQNLRSTNRRAPKVPPIMQMQSHVGSVQAFALTDKDGTAKVNPCFHYADTHCLTIAYPEIEPRFFAEIQVPRNRRALLPIHLQPAVEIEGPLTINGEPLPHGLVQATATTAVGGKSNYQVLEFLGVSDPDGMYRIAAPDSPLFGLTLASGTLTRGLTLTGNEPLFVGNNDSGLPLVGPELQVLKGDRKVECTVVNQKGREDRYATVSLLPDPGQVVLGTNAIRRDGNRIQLSAVPKGPIRVTANLAPIYRPGGSSTKMMATTPIIQPGDVEVEIVIAPAKFFPLKPLGTK